MRPNANNMASKHFPVDFFNQKMKKQSMMQMLPTNDETIRGNSFENVPLSDNGTQDYMVNGSLTIDYERPVELVDKLDTFI